MARYYALQKIWDVKFHTFHTYRFIRSNFQAHLTQDKYVKKLRHLSARVTYQIYHQECTFACKLCHFNARNRLDVNSKLLAGITQRQYVKLTHGVCSKFLHADRGFGSTSVLHWILKPIRSRINQILVWTRASKRFS